MPAGPFGTTAALTHAVASGDPRAVAQLYTAKKPLVYAAVRRAGFDEHAAMDVVQETFIKVIRGIPPISAEPALDAWLRRVALRTALDRARGERRRRDRERGRPVLHDDAGEDRAAAVRAELDKLPGPSVELLQLRFQAGLTLDAIARRIGTSASAVDGRIKRALHKLRRAQRAEEDA